MRNVKLRLILAALISAISVSHAAAHDFWLQPEKFQAPARETIDVDLWVGHGSDKQAWGVPTSRVLMLRSLGPEGWSEHKDAFGARVSAARADLRFEAAGVHVVALEADFAKSTLPAARFHKYARDEGLKPILSDRARTGRTKSPGREIYSRRAKAIVQIGPPNDDTPAYVTRPLGLTLEIVPEQNPYAVRAGPLSFRIYYKRRPLAGALVKMTDLAADAHPVAARTSDRVGRVTFKKPHGGVWLVNVVWATPLKDDPRADYETIFSSLTFGLP